MTVIKNTVKRVSAYVRNIFWTPAVFYTLTAAPAAYAADTASLDGFSEVKSDDIFGMKGFAAVINKVVSVLAGNFAKAIAVACLAACAIAYIFNKDNEKMKRNIIAIAIGIGILIGSASVVNLIWSAS